MTLKHWMLAGAISSITVIAVVALSLTLKGWKVEGFAGSHSTGPIPTEGETVSLVENWSTVGWAVGMIYDD